MKLQSYGIYIYCGNISIYNYSYASYLLKYTYYLYVRRTDIKLIFIRYLIRENRSRKNFFVLIINKLEKKKVKENITLSTPL